jgi:hypothetical protein
VAGDIGEQLVEGVDIRRAEPGLPLFQAREQIRGHWFELITMSAPSVPAFWYGLPEASVSPSTFVPVLPPAKSTNPTCPQSSGQQVAMTLPLVWHPEAGLLNELIPVG